MRISFVQSVKREFSGQFEQCVCGDLFYRESSCIFPYFLVKLVYCIIELNGYFFHLDHLCLHCNIFSEITQARIRERDNTDSMALR